MTDELIDICDEDNNITKVQKLKSEAHKKGLWHRAVHIWIYNAKGDVLLQLRSKNKLLYPGLWDLSVAGHISAHESPINSALREIREEVGLVIEEKDLQFSHIRKVSIVFENIRNNEFFYVYILNFDDNIDRMTLQNNEVREVRFMSKSNLLQDLKKNPEKYVPHGKYWSDMINKIKKCKNN